MNEFDKPVLFPNVTINHDEKDEGLIVEAELPGAKKDAIDLTLGMNGFCVSAEREDMRYEGCFRFAHEVEKDQGKAKFENGLLKIRIPFKELLRGKRIEIE